ncbi:c-type cytochrome [Roseomonas sp. F4]
MSDLTRPERQSRRIGVLAALVVAALAISILAYNNLGDDPAVAAGRWTAENRCGGCHDVARTAQAVRRGGAPSFVMIAATPTGQRALLNVLQSPHATMPPIEMAAEEKTNLLAYVASLAPR